MKSYKNILWVGGTILLFGLFYLICRYGLFDFHGMKDGPMIVAFVGIVALLISYALKMRVTTISAVLGYPIAFIIGILFETDSIFYPGGASSNLWHIWIISYWIFIAIGTIADVVIKIKRNRNNV